MLGLVALGELLGMTLWFSATAVTPTLVAELSLDAGQAAWLTMAVQAGFVCGTLVSALLNLPDVMNARWLFLLGCGAGAAANAAVAWSTDPDLVIAWRFATGLALAGVYPPGLKIAAGWFANRRGTALGILIGALTLGSSVPQLLTWLPTDLPWRQVIRLSSLFALTGGVLVAVAVRDGPHVPHRAPFDPRAAFAVFVNRGTRLATLGYLGHMWELYAMWTWMAPFAAASLLARNPTAATSGALVAFVAIASGAAGCTVAGLLADRIGHARIAGWSMVASGGCAAATVVVFGAPPAILYAFAVLWGITVIADSAQFSTLVTYYSPGAHVGTALTMQTCLGFLLTMVTIRAVPAVAAAVGWQWGFLLLAPGPALGAIAMRALWRRPPVVQATGAPTLVS
jgi:MFS family permease|tara:strand:- start:3907 stop:5100 length:1194 start_codon:yes stop_codon:yes gene_type:complete